MWSQPSLEKVPLDSETAADAWMSQEKTRRFVIGAGCEQRGGTLQ